MLLFLARWVASSSGGSRIGPVAFLVVTRSVTASPLRCWTGLSVGRSTSGKGRHLGARKVVFCPKAQAGHVS